MQTIYLYVLDTLADWEIGHIIAELQSGRFFKVGAKAVTIKTVSHSKTPIRTMGGMTITPDCLIDEMNEEMNLSKKNLLILPGAETWHELRHQRIIKKASDILARGETVAGICGATVPLANFGLLDARQHSSNGQGFLDMMAPNYKGQANYQSAPVISDQHLITAG